MFCKYCGRKIDRKSMTCTSCGRPVGPLEGGVGFWDLAGERPKEAPQEKVIEIPQRIMEENTTPNGRETSEPEKKKILSPVLLLGAGLCVLCLIISFALIGRVNRLQNEIDELRDMALELSARMNDQTHSTDVDLPKQTEGKQTDVNMPIETKIPNESASFPEDTTCIPEETEYHSEFRMIKEPESDMLKASQAINPLNPVLLFTLKAEGGNYSVHWYKEDDLKKDWKSLDKDIYYVETSFKDGVLASEVKLLKMDPGVFGEYRYVIRDEAGYILHDGTVTLDERV